MAQSCSIPGQKYLLGECTNLLTLVRCRPRPPRLGSSRDQSAPMESCVSLQTASLHLYILSKGCSLSPPEESSAHDTQADLCSFSSRRYACIPPSALWHISRPSDIQRWTSDGRHSPHRCRLGLRLHVVHFLYSFNRDHEEPLFPIASSSRASSPYKRVIRPKSGIRYGTEAIFLGPARTPFPSPDSL